MVTHILLIEDEAPLRAQVAEMLRLEGYEVTEAENGGIALGLLQSIRPNIILCDIAMPDFDGYQILQHVRQNDQLAQLPFIFLTARADRSFVRHGMELGADDYITKPFSRKELLAAIDSRLARYDASSQKNETDLVKAKKQLSHMVAHELRTPLISTTMVHEIISMKLDELSTEEMRGLLEMMQSGNQRMAHLVEQMVIFTELNTGMLSAEKLEEYGRAIDIQMLINESIKNGRNFAYRNKSGQIKRPQKQVYAPVYCLMQALSFAIAELVSNALIYSPDNSSVVIEERVIDDWVHINIVDTGPGLTTNRLRQASMPFEQIDRESKEQQGMGMGLPLAIRIVEMHGGDIDFQSTASGGTKVSVKLPVLAKED